MWLLLMVGTTWHEGERIVQRRLDATEAADKVARIIHSTMPDAAKAFLFDREWFVVTVADPDGRLWTSVVSGAAGFLAAEGDDLLVLDTDITEDDPVGRWLVAGAEVGGLAIDLSTRRRMRLNGTVEQHAGRRGIRTAQVLSNCPKFIQKRLPTDPVRSDGSAQSRVQGAPQSALSDRQREWVRSADTLFVGSAGTSGRADTSHRGGRPGFLDVTASTIAFDELPGNSMYMTLGNFEQSPAASLLFIDFDSGSTLHLTGAVTVSYDGAAPRVEFAIEKVIERAATMPTAFGAPEYSPHLPDALEPR